MKILARLNPHHRSYHTKNFFSPKKNILQPLRKKKRIIEQDEYYFTDNKNLNLITEGVSTCIAFFIRADLMINGSSRPICGLYHWSGFGVLLKTPKNPNVYTRLAKQALSAFFYQLHNNFNLNPIDNNFTINCHQLGFIGGERAIYKTVQNKISLVLSGTEAEVHGLRTAVKNFDFSKFRLSIKPSALVEHFFIHHPDADITVKINMNDYSYEINHKNPISDDAVEQNPSQIQVKF